MALLDALLVTLMLLEPTASASPAAVDLSLAEAQDRAAARAPEVNAANGRVRSAAATRIGADVRVPVNPRLSVDARPGLDADTRGKLGFASSLDLLLELGDVPGARLAEADQRTRSAEAEAGVVR